MTTAQANYDAALPTEGESRAVMEAAMRQADLPGRAWPLGDHDVIELAGELGYHLDRARLAWLLGKGRIPAPPVVRGANAWSARHALGLLGMLEGLRLWRWGHRLHAAKWNEYERVEQLARAEGDTAQLFQDLEGLTVRELLLQLAALDDRAGRERLVVLIRLKLERCGVDPHE